MDGDRRNGGNLKTEAMYFPPPGKTATTMDTDILINKNEFFSYCNKFKYLGTIFTPSLKDDLDIQRQITKACGAFTTMEFVLYNKNIPANFDFDYTMLQ